jgi:glutamine amidotransferase
MNKGKECDNGGLVRVAIVDFEMCNLFSVTQACGFVGLKAVITSDRFVIAESDAIILPGVGAFGDAMSNLKRLDLIEPIKDCLEKGTPLLGICLGMQLLFSESEEFGMHKGLDIIEGAVHRFPTENDGGKRIRVPHVGWNQIRKALSTQENGWDNTPLEGIKNEEYMYFVHSYFVKPDAPDMTLSLTGYEGIQFCSSIHHKNVFACQFHPEKSAIEGIRIYKNWAKMLNDMKKELN